MTISITRRLKKFVGNGSATVFPYDFFIPDADSVYVVLYNTTTDARVVLDASDYSIDGLGDPAFGNVTYPLVGDPISSDYWLIVTRQVDYVQDLDIPNQSTFYPEVLEAKLDDLVMMVQQLAETQARSIQMLEGEGFNNQLGSRASAANKYLRFDGNGDPATDSGPIVTGVLPLASQGDAVAGINNAALMTPLRTAQAIEGYGLVGLGTEGRALSDRFSDYIDPRDFGAIPDLSDASTLTANNNAFQEALDQQTALLRPIIVHGTYYISATLLPTSRLVLLGTSRYHSFLRFKPGNVDAVMFDFDTGNVSDFGGVVDSVGFKCENGQSSSFKNTCFQFRTNGDANQLIVFSRFYAEGWSDAFIELPQTWNCHFEDFYITLCGRSIASSGWTKEGAGIRVGFLVAQGDIVTTGNVYTNGYINSCNHGISHQDADIGQNLVLFNQFNNIICELNNIGIYAPTSSDCSLNHCYFEGNVIHGAQMGHAFINGCRYRPTGTDDILLDNTVYPWQYGLDHREYFCSEIVCFEGDDGIHEIWAPEYGIISFASPNADFNGLVAVKTNASPAGTAITTFGATFQIQLAAPNLAMWDTFITLCIPGDGTLSIQNRSGATLEWTYHVVGGKPTGGPAGGF